MQLDEVMAALVARGVTGEVRGASFADLYALQRRAGVDHALARALWATDHADARSLALMLADPGRLTLEEAERWLDGAALPGHVEALARLVARAPFAPEALERWTAAPDDPRLACGHDLLAATLVEERGPDDARCAAHLDDIRRALPAAPDRARQAMSLALVAIGVYRPALRDRALAVGRELAPAAEASILRAVTGTAPGTALARKPPARKKGAKATSKKKATMRTPRT